MLGHDEEWDTNSRSLCQVPCTEGGGTNSVRSGVCVSLFCFNLKCDDLLSIAVDILEL